MATYTNIQSLQANKKMDKFKCKTELPWIVWKEPPD